MEGKIGLTESLLIAGIALLLFGPGKFASLGKGIGESIRNFKASMKDGEAPKTDKEKEEAKKEEKKS